MPYVLFHWGAAIRRYLRIDNAWVTVAVLTLLNLLVAFSVLFLLWPERAMQLIEVFD